MTEANHFTGDRILELRKAKGLSKKEFAYLIGCSTRQLHRWEKKKEEVVKMSLAFERAILGLSLNRDWIPEHKKERGLA